MNFKEKEEKDYVEHYKSMIVSLLETRMSGFKFTVKDNV